MAKVSAADRQRVKGMGYLSNKGGEKFSARVVTGNGVVSSEQMHALSDIAERYGNGRVTFTSRLTVEIPGIDFESIDAVNEAVSQIGLSVGGTGPKVRPVVACKGTVCVFGRISTQEIAAEMHKRFYEGYHSVKLPHKFKIGVGGCPNNCIKPDLNDFGVVGQRPPKYSEEDCQLCKSCAVETGCPMKAAELTEDRLVIDGEKCNNCGICIDKCIFNALGSQRPEELCKIYIGGRWGKSVRRGTPLDGLYTVDEMMNILEKSILLFKEKGLPGERFGSMIDRIGVDAVQKELLSDEILERKEKILCD